MKLRMKRKAMVVLAAGMLMSAAAPAAAMAAEKATGPALTASYNGDVNTLEAAKDATQLIVVIGNRQDPAKSCFSASGKKRATTGTTTVRNSRSSDCSLCHQNYMMIRQPLPKQD